jgi:hypothetical protein
MSRTEQRFTRRSSVYTLRLADPSGVTSHVPGIVDQGSGSVSFRAGGDEAATRVATDALTAAGETGPAELTTGLGLHKRTVAVQG